MLYRLKKKAEQVVKEEAKGLANTSGNDEILSIRTLMARQESSVLINDPREYQIELFEKAKRQNIIAVLDTGYSSRTESGLPHFSLTHS